MDRCGFPKTIPSAEELVSREVGFMKSMKSEISVSQRRWNQLVLASIVGLFIVSHVSWRLRTEFHRLPVAVFAIVFASGQIYWLLKTGFCMGRGGGVATRELTPKTFWSIVAAFFGVLVIGIVGIVQLMSLACM